MSNFLRHPFHLVDESPWPLLASFRGLGLTSGLLKWFHGNEFDLLILRIVFLILISFQWWRDVRREGSYMGFHTSMVELGLRWGIILFIVSEVFFFVSFFWAFFHRSLAVNIELGNEWPPLGILAFSPFGSFLAHLVPLGTPYILIPFIVLIEFVRNIIRPITLSVRLAANLVAGHLLITLIRSPAVFISYGSLVFLIRALFILIILESAVAFIQAYVFRMLRTLYLREVNSLSFN